MNDSINQWDTRYDNLDDYLAFTTQDTNNILNTLTPTASKTLLDIGCGTGQIEREFFHRGYTVVGIDSSARAIEIAKAATIYDSITYIHSSLEDFATRSDVPSSYGLIMCKYVFAFINDRDFFLNTVKKMLERLGTFVLISPDRDKLPAERSGISIPHEELLAILSTHFSVSYSTRGRDNYYICRHKDN
jgi:2-polyprenyl-3-methyl-5-hydroxy-6-metoxy-1,4-benzoquinol methylase